jgi:Domain of unknown function (DUF4186)
MGTKPVDEIDLDEEPPPLPKMTCTSTNCNQNQHCFLPKKSKGKKGTPGQQLIPFEGGEQLPNPPQPGQCRDCGAQLVNWDRLHSRKLTDVVHTVEMLKLELWRQYYWSRPIDQHAVNHARRQGHVGLRQHAEKTVRKRLGPANPTFEFRQTKLEGNIVCYAQHATGTCCRKCLRYWHGVDNCHSLTEEEIAYVLALVHHYIGIRLRDLPENGVKVARIRTKKPPPKG